MIYEIEKGSPRWHPVGFNIFRNFRTMRWEFYPTDSMIFNYEYRDPEYGVLRTDEDWKDWKKIGGISLANWRNLRNIFQKNRDAIMLAWRWNVELEVHECCLYVNEKGRNVPYEGLNILRMHDNEPPVIFEIDRLNKREYACWLYRMGQNRKHVNRIIVRARDRFNLYSWINPWYGGANNSPGPWGGAAPKDMGMRVDFDYH